LVILVAVTMRHSPVAGASVSRKFTAAAEIIAVAAATAVMVTTAAAAATMALAATAAAAARENAATGRAVFNSNYKGASFGGPLFACAFFDSAVY